MSGTRQLSRPVRRTVLVLHACASAGWLGLTVALLALGVSGGVSDSAAAQQTAYRAMHLFGDWLLLPLALTTLGTGVVLGVGTHWGLLRHHWVQLKLWLTLAATAATTFLFRPGLADAAAAASAGEPVRGASYLAPPIVSLSLYLFMTALSVLKPWGRTRRGHRALRTTAARRTAGPPAPGAAPNTASTQGSSRP